MHRSVTQAVVACNDQRFEVHRATLSEQSDARNSDVPAGKLERIAQGLEHISLYTNDDLKLNLPHHGIYVIEVQLFS
jgi:hypothetical protein